MDFKHIMVKKLLLRTVLIGGLVLGQLSFFIWLINYLHVDAATNAHSQSFKDLISNAHADSQLLAYAAPLMSPPQAASPKKNLTHQHANVSNLQISPLDKSRLLLNFPNENFQINEEERDLLEQYLTNLQITRGHTVRLYVEASNHAPEENLITRPVSKLRAQSIARVIYPFTQNVEIIFTSQQSQAGSLIIDVGSFPARATS
jgi:hypothetical protein